MDLSKLSDKDLEAIAAGRMQDVSTAGLQMLAGEAPAAPRRPRSEELLRQLGLTARAGIEGVTSLPAMVANVPYALADIGISLAQKAGANIATLQQRGISATRSGQIISDILGLPKPETEMERGVQSIAQAMGGAAGSARMAEAAGRQLVSPIARQVAQTLATSPLAQTAAAATAASATEAVKEMGGGTGAQLAAGLLGGAMIPGGGTAAQAVGRAAPEVVRPFTQAGREVINRCRTRSRGGCYLYASCSRVYPYNCTSHSRYWIDLRRRPDPFNGYGSIRHPNRSGQSCSDGDP
jgi:hypothetical protein